MRVPRQIHQPLTLFIYLIFLFNTGITFAAIDQNKLNKVTKRDRQELVDVMTQSDFIPVIVKLKEHENSEQRSGSKQQVTNRANVRSALMAEGSLSNAKNVKTFESIPFMAMRVNETMLTQLNESEIVDTIQLDRLNNVSLDETVPFIEADLVWQQGFIGNGQAVAIIDTGVDNSHSFFSGRVVSEACYSSNVAPFNATSVCRGGETTDIGVDAGVPCSLSGCDHGTHVAGIATGISSNFSGVAQGADIIAIQVFSEFIDSEFCGFSNSCVLAFDSDIISGLDRVYQLRDTYNIAAINLSLGGGEFASAQECDLSNAAYRSVIDNLVSADIAVVAASGNNGFDNGLNSPACLSDVISVGAVNNTDVVQSFSNSADYLDFLAPGVSVLSSEPGDQFGVKQGTSMASPHVAGAIALLKSADTSNDLNTVLSALTETGIPVLAGGHTTPRISVFDAYTKLTGNVGVDEPSEVSIVVSTDNSEEVYFNGVLLGTSSNWETASEYSVNLNSGTNVLAIKAQDVDGVASLIAQLDILGLIEVSGNHWRISLTEEDGWQDASFDDSGWDFATAYGSYGISPWRNRVNGFDSDSDAQWIWSGDNSNDDVVFFRLVIENGPQITAPVIVTNTLNSGQVGLFYTQVLIASDGSSPYQWSILSGSLPSGLSLSTDGVISGIPIDAETALFELEVVDSNNQVDTIELSIDIAPITIIDSGTATITTSADNSESVYFNGTLLGTNNNWQRASEYSVNLEPGTNVFAIRAEDADGVASLIAQLDIGGLIEVSGGQWRISTQEEANWNDVGFDDSNWDFATTYGSYGVSPWQQQVSGFNSSSSAQWIWSSDNFNDNVVFFRLVIENGNDTPVTPVIDTDTLDSGEVGSFYNHALVASNGLAPYVWSVSGGELAEGLNLSEDGILSGTPSQAEFAEFQVQVTDSNNQSATAQLSLVIDAQPFTGSTANIVVTADNREDVYFNGVLLGSSSNWQNSSEYSVDLVSGENVFAFKGQDVDGVAALIAQIDIDGLIEVSGNHWRVSLTESEGWEQAGFDDSAWDFATTYGSYGATPWGRRVSGFDSTSIAQWIWSADNVNDDVVYFRLVIQN